MFPAYEPLSTVWPLTRSDRAQRRYMYEPCSVGGRGWHCYQRPKSSATAQTASFARICQPSSRNSATRLPAAVRRAILRARQHYLPVSGPIGKEWKTGPNKDSASAQCVKPSGQTHAPSLAVTAAHYMTTYPSSYTALYACSAAKKYLPTE